MKTDDSPTKGKLRPRVRRQTVKNAIRVKRHRVKKCDIRAKFHLDYLI